MGWAIEDRIRGNLSNKEADQAGTWLLMFLWFLGYSKRPFPFLILNHD